MAQISGPSEPNIQPLPQGAEIGHTLEENQLFALFKKVLGEAFDTLDPQHIAEQSLARLTPLQKQNLFALIPPDQESSDLTPNVNIVLEAKKRFDLTNICKNPMYRDPILSVFLPHPSLVEVLPLQQIESTLKRVTKSVQKMMEEANYNPQNESPEALLRNPNEMVELLALASFSTFLRTDAHSLFAIKDTASEALKAKMHVLRFCIKTLADASRLKGLTVSEETSTLSKHLLDLLPSLFSAITAEDFQKVCLDVVKSCVQLTLERETLIKNLCRYLESQRETLSAYLHIEEIAPHIDQLLEGPALAKDSLWIVQIEKFNNAVLPYKFLLEKTREFLTPYLERTITPASEEVQRIELKERIIPQFIQNFPEAQLSEQEIEHFLLSAYLKIASGGVNLKNFENAYRFYVEEAGKATDHGNEAAAQLLYKKAEEINEQMASHFKNFVAGLKHALRIDFKSMYLTNKEIKWLADETLYNPTTPLPSDWREQAEEF